MLKKFLQASRARKGLLIIIIATLLIELLSAAQYYLTHNLLEKELEKRAESELTMKAILIKSSLNLSENLLKNFMWKIEAHLDTPDSAYVTMRRLVRFGSQQEGCGVGFEPNYYPSKGKLYEVYARRSSDGTVEVEQIGGPEHDYTKSEFYKKAFTSQEGLWVDPYYDNAGAHAFVTSYFQPVRDNTKKVVGVAVVDLSLKWLTDTIDNRHIYPSSFVLLLTEDGKPIIQPTENRVARTISERVISLINDSTVDRKKSSTQRSKMIKFNIEDRKGSIFYANMKGKPHWQLAIVCYDDEVYASLLQLRYKLMLLMLLAFGIMLYVIARYAHSEKKLQKKTLEQDRLTGELRIASDIQQALLPDTSHFSSLHSSDVSVVGRLIPAKAVGGDLYNAFMRDGKLFFCIGDVSGKGIPAALIMAITQTMFRNIASRESNPSHIMNQLNVAACRNNKTNVFITLFIGVLDLPTGHLRYCNAGHEIPILINDSTVPPLPLDTKPNLPIGLFTDFNFEMQEIIMQPGATLFLYTDGLTEARDSMRKLFGLEHSIQMLTECGTTDSKHLVETVIEEVQHFSEGTEQSDDLTLMAVNYTPAVEHYILDEELKLKNDVKDVAKLSTFVKDILGRLNIGKPLAPKLRLALEEAVVNVMEYAYPAGTEGDVDVRVTCSRMESDHHLKFIITDSGVSFNPTEAASVDTTLSAEDRPVGGLGILLVRELMDTVNYERTNGKNVLTLSKNVKKEQLQNK